MDIVIIADYLGPLDGTYNSRFLYLGDILAKNHNVEIVTSNFNHGEKCFFSNNNIEKHDFKITMINESGYKKNICLKRFWSDFIWGKGVKKYLQSRKKPDVVYAAIPPLTGVYSIINYCKSNGVRLVVDIQDLWPNAFKMVFDYPPVSDIIYYPLYRIENKIINCADSICAVSDTYVDYAKQINPELSEYESVYLGTDLSCFDENVKRHVKDVAEKYVCTKDTDEIWLAYCGSLSDSYDLKTVIDAIAYIRNKKIKFVVMGDGYMADDFRKYSQRKSVNCIFTGMLPYAEMCALLSSCDIAVNPIKGKSAASIINKHGDYAASGLPVINTQQSEEYIKLICSYNMGVTVDVGDSFKLAEHLKELIDKKELRQTMGSNARRCAEEKFNRSKTYVLLEKLIVK